MTHPLDPDASVWEHRKHLKCLVLNVEDNLLVAVFDMVEEVPSVFHTLWEADIHEDLRLYIFIVFRIAK